MSGGVAAERGDSGASEPKDTYTRFSGARGASVGVRNRRTRWLPSRSSAAGAQVRRGASEGGGIGQAEGERGRGDGEQALVAVRARREVDPDLHGRHGEGFRGDR